LSFRLFFLLFGSMALFLALLTAVIVREHRSHLMDTVSQSAGRASDVIRRATHASMLRNQRAELHEIIENIGLQTGIDVVRIYNKQGRIMFSTVAAEVGTQVDLQADACHRCHSQDEPRRSLESGERARIIEEPEHRILGWISPIPNEPACASAACHAHAPEQTVLGVLDVWMSLEQVDAQLHASSRRMHLAAGAVVLIVALSFAGLIRRLVQTPVERLIDGTRAVARGELDHEIDVHSNDDLGDLAQSFSNMTHELRRAHEENRVWAETLEDKVAEKTRALRRAHAHLVQVDRMASLGKLSTTVAHEINNPLAGILTYARLVERQLGKDTLTLEEVESIRRSMRMVTSETRRCGEIAQNLLTFARTSSVKMEPTRLVGLVDHSLGLVRHRVELHGIEVERIVEGEEDEVLCSPGEIQQALLGLLVNASEAMPNGGVLTLRLQLLPEEVRVSIRDTGVGIPAEVLPHVFEPFFTTKSETKGVGLGLSVVYGIMQRHGGHVEVQSLVDVGSTFILVWPRHPRMQTESHQETDATQTHEAREGRGA
jgi:two-component system NtrC family sensor kinase